MNNEEKAFLDGFKKADNKLKIAIIYILTLDKAGINKLIAETCIDFHNEITKESLDKLYEYIERQLA